MTPSISRLTQHLLHTERHRRIAMAGAFLLAAVLASASIFATGPSAPATTRAEKAWPVSVQNVSPEALRPTFTGYGRVESANVARLRTSLVAEVIDVPVKEGDWVEQGQVLVRLARAEVRLSVAQRQAELDQQRATLHSIETEYELQQQATAHFASMQQVAQNKLVRHQELMARRLISQALLDEVVSQADAATIQYQTHTRAIADFPNRLAAQRARIAMAEALLGQAQLDLDKTTVLAPFAGPVLGVFVAPGDTSNLGMPLVEVADADGFEVRVQIPASYAAGFERQLHTLPMTDAISASTSSGRRMPLVRLSSRVRDGQTGLDAFFQIRAAHGEPLPPIGRVLDLAITMPAEQNVVALPVQSIYENDRIYEVVNGRLRAIEIERIGELQTPDGGYRILVRSPALRAGQSIITTQLPKAISGLLVAPIAADVRPV